MFFKVTFEYHDGGPKEVAYCSQEELDDIGDSWYGVAGRPTVTKEQISRVRYLAKRNMMPAKSLDANPFL